MSKFISNFVFLLLFIICARFSIAESLDRTWINTCRVLNCQLSLDFCIQMNCLGKESCLDCISTFFPTCVDCSTQITSSPIALNGESHILCNQNEPLHQTSCTFFCRTINMVGSRCTIINNLPLCSCSEYQSSFLYTTRPTITPIGPTFLSQPFGNFYFRNTDLDLLQLIFFQVKSNLSSHTDQIAHIFQKANGELVTFSYDQTVKFWNLNTSRLLRTQKIHFFTNFIIIAFGNIKITSFTTTMI
jgi:hypothetical protein